MEKLNHHIHLFFFSLILMFSCFSFSVAHADFYLAATLSQTKTEYYTGVSDYSGPGFGAAAGYKFTFLAAEAFYKSTKYDDVKYASRTTGNEVTTTLSSSVMGAGGRLFFLFFNLKGGVASYDFDHTAKENGTVLTVEGNGSDIGFYAGAGFRIPLAGFLDFFADYTYYYAQDFDKDLFDLEGGVRVYF